MLPVLLRDYANFAVADASWILIILHLTQGTAGLSSGIFIRKTGSRIAYAIGASGKAIYIIILAITASPIPLFILAPLAGLSRSLFWSGAFSYVMQNTNAITKGAGSGLLSMATVLGPAVIAPLLALTVESFGLHAFLVCCVMLILVSITITYYLVQDTPRIDSVTELTVGHQHLVEMRTLLLDTGVRNSILTRMSTSFVFGVFILLSALKITDLTGSIVLVGPLITAGAIGGGIAQIIVGIASDKIGRESLLVTAVLLCSISSAVFGATNSLILLLICSSIQMLSQQACQTLVVASCGDHAQSSQMGNVMGLLTSAFSMAFVAGVVVASLGWMISYDTPFYIASLVCLSGMFSAAHMHPHKTESSIEK